MSGDERLARAQAALVAALTAGVPPPPGFDSDRLWAAAKVLREKRRRSVAYEFPEVPRALGSRFPSRFEEYARAIPLGVHGTVVSDVRRFLRWLASRGLLPPVLRRLRVRLWLRDTFGSRHGRRA
jgi:hypothetical protein